jgi:hypothetical protein
MRRASNRAGFPQLIVVLAGVALLVPHYQPAVEYFAERLGELIQRAVDAELEDLKPEGSSARTGQPEIEPDAPATPASVASSQPQPPPVDNFADPRPVRARLESKLGKPVRLLNLGIRSGSVTAEVQDPQVPEHIDEYTVSPHNISGPRPVRLFGKRAKAEALTKQTFDFAELDLGAIPKMVGEAPGRLGIADGKVTHVTCRRALPFSSEVRCNVYVSGSRDGGFIIHDGKGAVVRVVD